MKKIICFFTITISILVPLITQKSAVSAATNENLALTDTPVEIEYRSAIIRWRFKKIDGKAYKRRYNYSTDKWIGKWVPVA